MWDDDDGPPPPCEEDYEENEIEEFLNMTQRDATQKYSQAHEFLYQSQRNPDLDLFDAEFQNELELEQELRNVEGKV